jgi:hypothetical protein
MLAAAKSNGMVGTRTAHTRPAPPVRVCRRSQLAMDVLSPLLVILVGTIAAVVVIGGLDVRERWYAMLAFAAHVVCSFAQWAIVEFYYGISDVHGYQDEGAQLARLLDYDFAHFAPEVLKLALHMGNALPFEAFGDGSSTGTMSAFAGFCSFVAGSSPIALYLLVSWFSWFGLLCWYRIARAELEPGDRKAAAIGFLGVPSVVFWSAGFVKEAFVVGFFGVLGLSTYRLLRGGGIPYLFGVILGGVGIAMLKPYTLFGYVIAVPVFIYAQRAWRGGGPIRIHPAYLLLAGALSVGGVAAMGSLFPEYSTGRVAETMAYTQEVWQQGADRGVAGGSSIDIGSGEAKTIPQQLKFVPLALVNSLFRPVVFEARNAPAMGGAIENGLLLLAVLYLLAGGATRKVVRETLLRSPLLLSGIVFVFVFATGVGLATSNLGSLSRYRMPMMPFYVTPVLVLLRRSREASARATVRTRPVIGASAS